ncbi:MAG: DUF1549 domain-containing protein [Akkermansiaceae bacterium]
MKSIIITALLMLTLWTHAKTVSEDVIRNTSNEIDQFIANYLLQKEIQANPITDDATFARRSYINIAGRVPSIEEAKTFIHDTAEDKRATLIKNLIESNGHKSQMFNFWADLLRLDTGKDKHGLGWHVWIRDAVDTNMPYDQFVNKMLSASGSAIDNPAVGYYLRDRNMLLDNVSNTVQIFLGNRIGCAQCHDHPFEDITQKEYYEMAAFSSSLTYKNERAELLRSKLTAQAVVPDRIKRVETSTDFKKLYAKLSSAQKQEAKQVTSSTSRLFRDIRKIAIQRSPERALKLPKDYQYNDAMPGDVVNPQTFFGEELHNIEPVDRQKAFADWVTNPQNPYFTKVIVNRLWAKVFGRGIVEPLDDWSETTTVSHPELLDYLCQVMIATGYDTKQFLKVLYNTRLFESTVAQEEDKMGYSCNFTGPLLRRMSAEEFHDSLITIEYGDQDATVNENLKKKWEQFIANTHKLYETPLDEILAFSREQSLKEKKVRAIREDIKGWENYISQGGDADREKIAEYLSRIKAARQEINNLKNSDKNEMSMMMNYGNRVDSEKFMRASEKPAPHKPGSLLREFGASDRNTPEASNTHATVPQALTLLNGKIINELTDRKGVLATAIKDAPSASERLDNLFLGIYGVYPTPAERDKYIEQARSINQLKPLARAMLTSKRFLFVQ